MHTAIHVLCLGGGIWLCTSLLVMGVKRNMSRDYVRRHALVFMMLDIMATMLAAYLIILGFK